jgi:hypothetical protein
VTTMDDSVEHLAHCIGRVGPTNNLEECNQPMLDPFLGGKLLQVRVPGTTAGATGVRDHERALVVLAHRGRAHEGKRKSIKSLH